jgi:hypothetical protein
MQAGAASDATKAQQQMYQQMRSDLMPYNQAGQAALNQLMSYWGLGSVGGSQNIDTTATMGKIKDTLTAWDQAMPGSGKNILNMINSGASLDQVNAAMNGLRGSTTNPKNTAFLDQAIHQGQSPVMLPAGSGGGATGGGLTAGSASNAFNMLQNYPGYQFQYGQGLEALNRNLAAGGRYTSGAMLKGAQSYGQGFAQNSVNQYLSMLQYLSGAGQNAAAMTGTSGIETGKGVASSLMAGGSASASGLVGAGNALGNALTGYAVQNQLGMGGLGGNMPMGGGSGWYGGIGGSAGIDPVYITPQSFGSGYMGGGLIS